MPKKTKGISFRTQKEANEYIRKLANQGIGYSLEFDSNKPKPYTVILHEVTGISGIEEKELAQIAEKESAEERKRIEKAIGKGEPMPEMTFGERMEARRVQRYGPGRILTAPPEEIPERIKERMVTPAISYTYEDIVTGLKKAKRPPDVVRGMKAAIPPRPYTKGGHPRIGAEGAIGLGTPRIFVAPQLPGIAKANGGLVEGATGISSRMRFQSPTLQRQIKFPTLYIKKRVKEEGE